MTPVLIGASAVLLAVSLTLMKGGMARARTRASRAASSARKELERGEPTDEVARTLAREARLPPLAAVRAMADAAEITPAEALAALRPHLTDRQVDVIDRMPTERFDRAMRDLSSH